MEATLAKVIAANPDRIAVYHYAHLPHLFEPQRRIAEAELPNGEAKLEILSLCIGRPCAAGYVYYRNELPIARGRTLNMDDALRRSVIQTLMCNFAASVPAIEQAFPVSFTDYFAAELGMAAALVRDGLLTVAPDWISVTLKGRLLIRNICMVFDRHLGADRVQRFSQTI